MLAGHALGGWALDEPGRAPQGLPGPGVGGIQSPITWYDTVTVTAGELAPWHGFDGSLARAEGWTGSARRPGAEAVVDLRSGDFGLDDNSISVDRRDSLSWLRLEAYGSNRGTAGPLDASGRHLWGVAGGIRRGRHAVEGGFAQRGSATRLVGSEEESASGVSGSVGYRYRGGSLEGALQVERGRDHRESFADIADLSRRDAGELVAQADVEHASGFAGHAEFRRAHVSRTEADAFEASARSAWVAARYRHAMGDGVLEGEFGAGRHSELGGLDWAPEISYRVTSGALQSRVAVERVLHAVWSDLAVGEDPFLQSTWATTVEMRLQRDRRHSLRAMFMAGRTKSRALVSRIPVTDFALRSGYSADPEPYAFGLLWSEARWSVGGLELVGEGFALSRPETASQPRVDPGVGLRAFAEGSFTAFSGDLGVTLRAGLEGVGSRESEADAQRVLPRYATSTVVGLFSLADALVTVRVRNLENRIHEEPWIDSATDSEALGTGREWRFALTLTLRN